MSYKTAAILGIVLGILLLPLFLVGVLLLIRSLALFRAYEKPLEPGTSPDACSWTGFGHDWRTSLPGYPPGVTCRNCLLRKDRAVIAWSGFPPSGIPAVPFPPHQLWVPQNVAKSKRKRGSSPNLLIMNAQPAVPQEIQLEIVGFGSP